MVSVILIEEEDVSSAWLKAVKEVLEHGDDISTQYDKPGEPPSKDATALIKVKEPFSNPIRNRRGKEKKVLNVKSKLGNSYEVYGHIGDFCLVPSINSGYIEEVLSGVFDNNLKESRESYPYSYHDRLYSYRAYGMEDIASKSHDLVPFKPEDYKEHQKLVDVVKSPTDDKTILNRANGEELDIAVCTNNLEGKIPIEAFEFPAVNQIDLVIEGLKKSPISRRIQAITWRPYSDPFREDPPCLQRLWFRIKGGKLILQTSWRSRDLFKAWQANVNAMIRIQKMVADKLNIETGEYIDFSNALHIYGKDVQQARELIQHLKDDE
ncbi:MAG: thymidylate synthase [Promethearchaeota archaeon]